MFGKAGKIVIEKGLKDRSSSISVIYYHTEETKTYINNVFTSFCLLFIIIFSKNLPKHFYTMKFKILQI